MTRFAVGLTVLALMSGAGPASAAGAPDPAGLPPSLPPMLAKPDHIAALLRAAHAVDPPGAPACADSNYVTTGEIGVLEPIETDKQGKVIGGAIKEGIRQTGCGRARRLNALTIIQPDGAMQTHALLPGSTITDPQLQQDSVPYAAGAMGEMPAGCDKGGVSDTRFLGVDGAAPGTHPSPGAVPVPWTEVWTLQACAKRAEVKIHFTPDPTGTEIRADPVGQ